MMVSYTEALQLLGLQRDARPTADVVRKAFRQQALKWHPDKQHPEHSAPVPSPTSCPDGTATTPASAATASTHDVKPAGALLGPEVAEERFKRLAAAYHLLLHAADSRAAIFGGAAASGAGAAAGPAGSHGGPGERTASAPAAAGDSAPQPAFCDLDDEALADALSADLLLEASRLRLSDFDMVFLHQRASGGADGLPSMWPEAVRSVDDIWRRIRRRVERRRKRAAAASGASSGSVAASGFTGAASKWALLFEFAADVVGAGHVAEPQPAQDADTAESAGTGVGVGAGEGIVPSGDRPHAGSWEEAGDRAAEPARHPPSGLLPQGAVSSTGMGSAVAAAGAVVAVGGEAPQPAAGRRRGRLPAGFYWRWIRRLVAARLLFGVFKGV